ncbi:UNVERIFIED_CONTAM: hypothetical protein Sradi_4339900 [Sesamum radiatum]|uniref:Stress regulated protein n=1 Tax=Sesamum radiatum TaxID=300843 RepID=A0AAW2NRE6_SESRA
MGSRIITYSGGALSLARRSCRIVSGLEQPAGGGAVRWQVLEQVDKELSTGNERAALNLVKDLQAKPGGLRCFGAARQIPQRLYTLDELRLNGIEAASLLSPVDTTLGSIERIIQAAALLGGIAAWNVFDLSPQQIFFTSLGFLFLWTFDAVSFNGGISFLVLDTLAHSFSQKYHNRVVQHEAGHFLIAYLLGILPKGYTLTSLDALKKEGSLNVQAGTAFVDFEFLEGEQGKSATTLNKFSCIALAGVATEYLLFVSADIIIRSKHFELLLTMSTKYSSPKDQSLQPPWITLPSYILTWFFLAYSWTNYSRAWALHRRRPTLKWVLLSDSASMKKLVQCLLMPCPRDDQ